MSATTDIKFSKNILEKNYKFKKQRILTYSIQAIFVCLIILNVLVIISNLLIYDDILNIPLRYPEKEIVICYQFLQYLQAFIKPFLVILFLIWIYRANTNLRALKVQGVQFSPGLSVISFFIPILSFWYPYQAIKEIWNASENKGDWKERNSSFILLFWWVLFLFNFMFDRFVIWISNISVDSNDMLNSIILSDLNKVLSIILDILAIIIISKIYVKQLRFFSEIESKINSNKNFKIDPYIQ